MGASQSNLTGSLTPKEMALSAKLSSRHAFQILKVHTNSPVSEGNVTPYFDFIISINGVEVSPDIPNIISEMARNHVNKPLKLSFYNSRQDEEREVTIVPRTGWGGEGLLGCAIRFCSLEGNIHENSPAQKAGLIANDDYVIACPDLLLRSEDEFYQLITQNTHRQVKLIIFNLKREDFREIVIVPDFEWGGEGCLGCDVGSGMVHWIPKKIFSVESCSETKFSDVSISKEPEPEEYIPPKTVTSASLLQAQYQQSSQPNSQSLLESSPSKPHVVSVNVPSSRPVFTDLGSRAVPATLIPSTDANAPPPAHYFNHPHSQILQDQPVKQPIIFSQKPIEPIDDIPLPNFTVPSDIINQN